VILALDMTAIVVSLITTAGLIIVATIGGYWAFRNIKAQVSANTIDIKDTGQRNAEEAANKVNAHLDNGLKSTLKRLDAKLTEHGVMVGAIVKTQDKPIIKTEPGGALIFANPAAMKLLGMTQAELSGDGWVRAVHPDDQRRVFSEWYDCVARKKEFGPLVYRYLHPTTKEVTLVEAVAIPVTDLDGEILSWIATIIPASEF
jgi:PAS domain S-box-containing protein